LDAGEDALKDKDEAVHVPVFFDVGHSHVFRGEEEGFGDIFLELSIVLVFEKDLLLVGKVGTLLNFDLQIGLVGNVQVFDHGLEKLK
jgi:hypothetical protein